VSFASAFVSAWLGGIIARGRMMLGMVGAISAAAGAWSMYSVAAHSVNGANTSAVLVERFAKCQAEFQPKGESRRKEAMDCDRAYAFQKWAGTKKVKVHKTDYAMVRFELSDGSMHTATVPEGKVETRGKPVGTTFDAVYDPANPSDVRARPNLSSFGFHLMMLAGGLGALGLSLLPQLLGLLGAGGSKSTAASQADAAAWGEDALKEAVARNQAATQRVSAAASGSRAGRGPATADGRRRQFGMRGA
jgi:hypothetical protein